MKYLIQMERKMHICSLKFPRLFACVLQSENDQPGLKLTHMHLETCIMKFTATV